MATWREVRFILALFFRGAFLCTSLFLNLFFMWVSKFPVAPKIKTQMLDVPT